MRPGGWEKYCIWEHSRTVRELYRQRCCKSVEEMSAHAQACELLAPRISRGDSLLDVGCGSGYFFHSLAKRRLPVDYWGVDASPSLIQIGREELPAFGLSEDRLQVKRIEDLDGEFDHIVCINVLSNIDNYHRPLERFVRMARKSVVLRESIKRGAEYSYIRDNFLDENVELYVHVNHYDKDEILEFFSRYGFSAKLVVDRRTGGKPEDVIGVPHYWAFVVAVPA